jgi:hypothetical protein
MFNETLRELRVEQHPDKTFIGRTERGFTFLGYWITKQGVTGVAPSARKAFRGRVARLYEQDAPRKEIRRRIGQYVRRWKQWVRSGVGDVSHTMRDGVFPGILNLRQHPSPAAREVRMSPRDEGVGSAAPDENRSLQSPLVTGAAGESYDDV